MSLKKTLVLMLTFSTLISFAQSPSGCDPNFQWVEYDVPFPAVVNHGLFASEYDNELYVLAQIDSTITVDWTTAFYHQILKLDTLSDSWETLTTFYHSCVLYDFEVHSTGIYISGALCGLNGDPSFQSIARFNGSSWESIPEISNLSVIGVILDMVDYGGNLIISGDLSDTTDNNLNRIAQFDGVTWSSLGLGFTSTNTGIIYCMAEYEDKLYIGGDFSQELTGNSNLSIWDGTDWIVSPAADHTLYKLHGTDTCLFAYGALLTDIGGTSVQDVAYFHTGEWHAMGGPISNFTTSASVVDINNQIYFDSNNGTLTYKDGSWIELPSVSDNWQRIVAYNNDLLHLGPDYSCGTLISGLGVLCDTVNCGLIIGNVYLDSNLNCINDYDGIIMPPIVEINPGGMVTTLDSLGNYRKIVKPGDYEVFVYTPNWYSLLCPLSPVPTTVESGPPGSAIDFSIEATSDIKDLQTNLTQGPARPGFATAIHVDVTNVGTTSLEAITFIHYADSMIYDSSSVALTDLGDHELQINWGHLDVFENQNATIYFTVPPSVTLLGQTLKTTITGTLDAGSDADLENNNDTVVTIITGAYDPNIKQVSPIGDTTNFYPGYVLVGTDEFTYTIHFQNTGSDTAFNVVLVDTLHQNLDITTFSLLGASHPVSYSFYGSNLLEFKFNNILLPDSSVNLLASQGYVKFKINTISGLTHDDEIKNSADIYFDFNPPIRTNTVINTLTWFLSVPVNESENLDVKIFPNPLTEVSSLIINGNENMKDLKLFIYSTQGQLVRVVDLSNKSEAQLSRDGLTSGLYLLTFVNNGVVLGSKKLIIE